jgi:uncharacterized protein (DUF169 family)
MSIQEDLMGKSINFARVAGGNAGAVSIENVADILERDLDAVIQEWLDRVEQEPDLVAIPLNLRTARATSLSFYVM